MIDMKRIILLTVMLLSVTIAFAQEGKNIYNKYSGSKDVSAVYISPTMFKMIGNLPDLNVEIAEGETINLAPLIKTFKGFYMLDISDKFLMSAINKDISDMMKNGRYELLMEIKDEEDIVQILITGNDKIIESFVFRAIDGDTLQFICIDGAMERSEIEKLMSSAMKGAQM